MSHPTISLSQQPDANCPHSVNNCILYQFIANDFVEEVGSKAVFTISTNAAQDTVMPASYTPMVFIGQDYTQGPTNTYNTIAFPAPNTQVNNDQLMPIIKAALEANAYLFSLFSFAISDDGAPFPVYTLTATARQFGEIPDFAIDLGTINDPNTRLNITLTNGLARSYLNNYKLVLEAWSCENGIPTTMQFSNSYTPDATGAMTYNLKRVLSRLYDTKATFAAIQLFDFSSTNYFVGDTAISQEFCVRYGEQYSDDLQVCGTATKTFATTPSLVLFHGALKQERLADELALVCSSQFMTHTPQFTKYCIGSNVAFWVNLKELLAQVDGSSGNLYLGVYYEIVYADGSVDKLSASAITSTPNTDGFTAINASYPSALADPNKIPLNWQVRAGLVDTVQSGGTTNYDDVGTWYASHTLQPDRSNCCGDVMEVYFLNEYGGFDTLEVETPKIVELESSSGIVNSYNACGYDLQAGMKEVNPIGSLLYTTMTLPIDARYQEEWFSEFINSPQKRAKILINGQEEFRTIILTDRPKIIRNKNTSMIRASFSFITNTELVAQPM